MFTYKFLALTYFVIPWTLLAAWYLTVIQGCGYYATRPYVEALCLQPPSSIGNGMPWYLDLWDAGNTHSSITPSRYMETIMTSHLAIKSAGIALQQQVMKLKAVPSDTMRTRELLNSLDQVIDMVSDLALQLDVFSFEICWEKDIMTHALRKFVEVYVMTIISSDYEDLTLPSILIFPATHMMRFISQQSLPPWLPEPKLYSFQVRAEIQFQKKRLIDELKESLDKIDASSLPTQLLQKSSLQRRYLEAAVDGVTIHQQSIRQMINESDSSLWRRIPESDEIGKLESYHRLGDRVHGHLLALRETMDEFEVYHGRLRSDIQEFRQSFEKSPLFGFSARSSLAVPAPLLAQVQNISLLSRGQSSRIDEIGDDFDVTHTTSHSRVFLGLDSIDDTTLSTLRSKVAQLCKAQKNIMTNSDDLSTICMIYNLVATMSALDDDPLSDFQTSWFVAREEAIYRREQELGLDLESILTSAIKLYKDYKDGTLVPENFDIDGSHGANDVIYRSTAFSPTIAMSPRNNSISI